MAFLVRLCHLLNRDFFAPPAPGGKPGQLDFSDPDQSGWIAAGF